MMLKNSIGKLQRCLSLSKCICPDLIDVAFEEKLEAAATMADDVKEGHFAVFAVKGGVPKRFVVELGCLADPAFLCLLEQAKEEYGFKQKGPLAIPCQPEELQKILQERSRVPKPGLWTTCNPTITQKSCRRIN